MTPQEQQMIGGLIDRVQQTRLEEKDSEAEQLLQQSLGRNPDALYILAQTTLVQQYALDQAQKQLADLKAQLDETRRQQQPRPATSFLGSLLGHNDPPPPPPPMPQGNSQPQYAPVQGYAPSGAYPTGAYPTGAYPPGPPQYPPQYGSQFGAQSGAPQGGGFLRSAMQTATGVAAGALAFEGIESLMHGFGGGGGAQGLGGFGGGAPREEIVNNYYGDSGSEHRDHGLSSDIEDRRGDSFGDRAESTGDRFADSGDDTGSDLSDDSSTDSGDNSSGDSGDDGSGDDGSFDSGDDSSFDSGGDDSNFS